MRYSSFYLSALLVAPIIGNYVVEAQRHERWPRQDLSTEAAPAVSTATTNTLSSPIFDSSSLSPSASSSNTLIKPITATSTYLGSAVKTSIVSKPTAPFNNMTSTSANTLPLEPKITPALSIAGVILMLTGALYALIGIKNNAVQISISGAYLIALAVTVLIVYVCSPPISLANQGAYFVAILVPAVVLGAAALKFKDFTEGLGCLLGGFTFSMWILVLKAGGAINSTGGKVIFIAVLCVAAFTMYFSRYTRSYGLMTCTSFSGATAIVLGIDCFSRAGLKEFWLWIWALNQNLFPLLTVTYPVTRGIQAEIAAIIVLAVFGVVSQMKLWRSVQEKKQRNGIDRPDEKRPEVHSEENPRRLEEGNSRKRLHWQLPFMEAQATRRQQIETDLESGRDSTEFRRVHTNFLNPVEPGSSSSPDIELDELEAQTSKTLGLTNAHERRDRSTVIRVDAVRDELFEGVSQVSSPNGCCSPSDSGQWLSQQPQPLSISSPDSHIHASASTGGMHSLPSQVPLLSREDTASLAAFASSNHPQVKRKSGFSLKRTLSVRSRDSGRNSLKLPIRKDSLRHQSSGYIESASRAANREDDRTESKGLMVVSPDISPPLSQLPSQSFLSKPLPATPGEVTQATNEGARSAIAGGQGEHPTYSQNIGNNYSVSSIPEEIKVIYRNNQDSPSGGKQPTSSVSELGAINKRSSVDSLAGRLPEKEAEVATVYRTNEWAKHLDPKDVPISDSPDDSDMDSDYSKVSGQSSQRPASLGSMALQQTALSAQPELEPLGFTRRSYEEPRSPSSIPRTFLTEYTNSLQKSSPVTQHHSYDALPSTRTKFPRLPPVNESSALISRKPVPQITTPNSLRERSSSSPLVESPIEENLRIPFSPPLSSPPPTTHSPPLKKPQTTKRDILLRLKHPHGSSSLSISTTPTDLSTPIYPDDSASMVHPRASSLDDDDISLSQRRSLLREQKFQARQSQRPSNLGPAVIYQAPPRSFTDPTSTARREAMLTAWRTSLQQDFAAEKIGGLEVEAGRAAMLNEKYKRDLAAQKSLVQKKVDREISEKAMINRGNLGTAHREVLRRMQGEANRRLSSEGKS
ncbi:MAG: hypothetical protein MMC33_001102 [Icmadophila ericetorum]|nr:hypothetical protein [Icmadophila ericetorum]